MSSRTMLAPIVTAHPGCQVRLIIFVELKKNSPIFHINFLNNCFVFCKVNFDVNLMRCGARDEFVGDISSLRGQPTFLSITRNKRYTFVS